MDLFEGSKLNPFRFRPGIPLFHHADWPAYPFEGAEGLLFRCSAFGPDVRLLMVSDIDQDILFAADVPCAKRSKFLSEPKKDTNFYVAGSHFDLVALQQMGLVSGVRESTLGEWDRNRRETFLTDVRKAMQAKGIQTNSEDMANFRFITKIDGEEVEIPLPEPYEDDEDDGYGMPRRRDWAILPERSIVVTVTGRNLIHDLLGDRVSVWMPILSEKVRKIFDLGFYDASIREACFDLEWSIKTRLRTTSYGEQLINEFMDSVNVREEHAEVRRRTLHQDLRAIFKLIRNRFAHVLIDIDETGAMVNLARIAWIRHELLG